MAITVNTDMFTPQILIDAVRARFRTNNAFMGSPLVSGGAVTVNGSMPQGGPGAVGKTIDIPYFGVVGPFVPNADGTAITPQSLAQTSEQATIARESLAIETSAWAQGVGQVDPALGDPHEEGARQVEEQATRAIDRLITTEFATTPLVEDVYNVAPGSAKYFEWDTAINAASMWGDEQEDIVAMVMHSRTRADLAKLRDGHGAPLLLSSLTEGQTSVTRFAGIPSLTSDRAPLDGSTMGAVVSTGSSPPVATLAGTPLGAFKLVIDAIAGTATTLTFRFSTDGGNTWSVSTLTVDDDGVPVPLTDTAIDSLVGVNGATGLTVAYAAGTFDADNQWKSKANLKATTLICQRGAGAFWYNAQRLGAKTDTDILADTDIMAMHLYHAPKLYRRRRMGSYPGVIAVKHNVRDFVGVIDF